jgi:uncharacterized membrane protein YfcA
MNYLQHPAALVAFGLFVGIFSGLMGLGGGAVIIPVLVLLFDFQQSAAHGTSLAMILSPTQLPAILNYHRNGLIDWRLVMWVLPGMLSGSYLGSLIATNIPQNALKLTFGMLLIYVAGYTIFGIMGREHLLRTVLLSTVLVLVAGLMFLAARHYDARAAEAVTSVAVSPSTAPDRTPAD